MGEGVELPTWVRTLYRPIKMGFFALLAVLVLSQFIPNYYRSEARILPVEGKGLSGSLGGLMSTVNALGFPVPGEGGDANFVDILQSRTLRENIVRTPLTFHWRSWRFGTEREYRTDLLTFWKERSIERAVKHLDALISISRDQKTKVIVISVTTRSRDLSQAIGDRAIRELEAFLQNKNRTRGGYKAEYATQRLAESREEADRAEQALRRFQESNRNFLASADPGVRLTGMRLEAELRLKTQLVATMTMNREQALMEEKNDIPILTVMDPPNLPFEKSAPARALLAIGLGFLTVGLAWAIENKEWVTKILFTKGAR